MKELYGTRYQSCSFSLINVGSGFHCLRSFPFSSSSNETRRHAQLLAVTIRVIWLVVGFTVEVVRRSQFIEDSIFWFCFCGTISSVNYTMFSQMVE